MDRRAAPDWHRHRRRQTAWSWLSSPSDLQNIERALDHPPRRPDHVDIGLIRALRFAQVAHLDQRIDVGKLDVAAGIGGGMSGLVLGAELRWIGAHRTESDHAGVERAVDLGAKGCNLAPE